MFILCLLFTYLFTIKWLFIYLSSIHDDQMLEDELMEEASNAINILSLLEKKMKGLKKDGLYKFVLWREALKDEKSKMSV